MKDVRDQKELVLLSRILSDLAHDRLPQLADLVTMRIRELRAAKYTSAWLQLISSRRYNKGIPHNVNLSYLEG